MRRREDGSEWYERALTTTSHERWTRFVAQHGPDLPTRGYLADKVEAMDGEIDHREAGGVVEVDERQS